MEQIFLWNVAFFIPCKKVKIIGILTGIGSIFGGFILATALNSPNMLLGQEFGGFLTVCAVLLQQTYNIEMLIRMKRYVFNSQFLQINKNMLNFHSR